MAEYNPSKIIKDGNTYNFRDTTKIPLAGSNQISGSLIPATTNTYNLGSPSLQWNTTYTRNILIDNDINIASSLINKTSSSGTLALRGGLTTQDGASIGLYGKDYVGALSGSIYMTAYGNSDSTSFRIYPNGIIRVTNNSTDTTKNVAMQEDVIPRSGGAVMTGNILGKTDDTSSLSLYGGQGWGHSSFVTVYGINNSDGRKGWVQLHPYLDDSNSKDMMLYPNGTWTWQGTACQIISDQRLKQQIAEIDDKLLDAWEDVEPCQFKYNDAVKEKSDNARLHTGYVVQQIDDACKSHGVDVSKYGLYCHEEYAEETREVENDDGTKTTEVVRPASEHYSLRYTEALIVECAYLRKKLKELTVRIEQLEKGNNVK